MLATQHNTTLVRLPQRYLDHHFSYFKWETFGEDNMFGKNTYLRCLSRFTFAATLVFSTAAFSSESNNSNVSGVPDNDVIAVKTINPEIFVVGALASSKIIDCTLADGTKTQCYELVTTGNEKPTDLIGPFCPGATSSAAEEGGVWLDGESIYEATGEFFLNLPNLYGEAYPPAEKWLLYDENGDLRVTNTLAACQAAARPNVDPEYQSYCVQCSLDDLSAEITTLTFTIPVTPVPAVTAGSLSGTAGISLNGFQIAAQAPVQDILSNWTIAAFDDCGGHVNPNDGYHYHAATAAEGCNSAGTEADGHPALMGFAMDGYGIYGPLAEFAQEASALDECNGVEDDIRGYHYHAGSSELNQHIACFHGVILKAANDRPPRRARK